MLTLLGASLLLRAVGLDYALWYDEIASTYFALTPLGTLWSGWMVRETNPPLYYSLLGGWTTLFGDEDVTLRAMSVVIGSGGVLLAFLVGQTVAGVRAGLIAAGLLATSAQHVLYSQQVRGYVLAHAAALAATLGVLLFLRSWSENKASARRRGLALYAIGCIVALYSHTTLVLMPLLVNVYVIGYLLIAWRGRATWVGVLEWATANVLVLLAWTWWAWITLLQAGGADNITWIPQISVPEAVRITLESYISWKYGKLPLSIGAIMIGLAGWGAWRTRARGGLLLATLAMGTPAMLLLISLKVPIFLPRTVYWAAGPFLVLVTIGVATLPRLSWRLGASAVIVATQIAALALWWPDREIEPWRALVRDIAASDPDRVVVALGKGPAYAVARYCEQPTCRLRVRTMPSPSTDTWASGFAPLAPLADANAPALLRREGLVTTIRWVGFDAAPAMHGFPIGFPVRYNNRGSIAQSTYAPLPR